MKTLAELGYKGPIDIVFTVWKETACTQDSLMTLLRNTTQPFNIIIVSGDESVAVNGNIGFERCKSPVIASVDDDVYVPKGWLERLVGTLTSIPEAAVVAPRIDGPSGLPSPNSTSDMRNAELRQAMPHFISGCCFVAENNPLFRYDEQYRGSGWEDTDFFRSVHRLGRTMWHDAGVRIRHVSRQLNNAEHYVDNALLFHKKWPPPECMCCETERDMRVTLGLEAPNEQ
jgi:glycosyltransferase involved in cell wall biosynthesis